MERKGADPMGPSGFQTLLDLRTLLRFNYE